MRLLATTNRGLEAAACAEIERLTGATAERHHPGWIAFEAAPGVVPLLNRRARTLHRVLIELVDAEFADLDDIAGLSRGARIAEYVDGGPFAVDSTRIGTHSFGSPDVASVVGEALIDDYRQATGDDLPVDLDDPSVVVRSTVRMDRFTLALDTTGERSLHRRPYLVRNHPEPVRPTMAATMLDLVGFNPGESIADPFAGAGTIPVEAALAAAGRAPNAGRESFAHHRLPCVPADPPDRVRERASAREDDGPDHPTVVAADRDGEWVRHARENAAAAGVAVECYRGDATAMVPDVDVIATDLPFNVRSNHGDLRPLYRGFSRAVETVSPVRAVVLTTRPDLLDLPVEETLTIQHGRLKLSIVLAKV